MQIALSVIRITVRESAYNMETQFRYHKDYSGVSMHSTCLSVAKHTNPKANVSH
jgi:hypothetical protein